MQTTSTKETDDDNKSCPPGMTMTDGHCVPKGENKSEDSNAGDTSDVGAKTIVDADTAADSNPKSCPDGSHLVDGVCIPNSPDAGSPGASDAPSVPGKELAELIANVVQKNTESTLAQYGSFFQSLLEKQSKKDEAFMQVLSRGMGLPSYTVESAAFGHDSKVKKEASSTVDDSKYNAVYESTVAIPAAFFEDSNKGLGKRTLNWNGGATCEWTIKPEAFFDTLDQRWINYGTGGGQAAVKGEAFTITGGDMPQIFSKKVYLIPGGRMRVAIRQFLDTQILEDADRFNWYKVTGFAFDDTTSEGTEPTNEAQTVTKVTATPGLVRAVQTVNYSDIENAPFDLIEAFNRAAALGALDAEAKEVLDTTYNAISPTNWVNANTGAEITDDDVASMTLKQEGIYAAKRLIEVQGGDTSPGQLVAFLHPKAVEELILDTAADFFTGQNALHSTALGVLENRLGLDIVVTNRVNATDNTTNDTYRNVIAMKGSIGLAVAADLQIEAQRRPDLSAVKVGARHRIKGAVIDETMTCRCSSAQ